MYLEVARLVISIIDAVRPLPVRVIQRGTLGHDLRLLHSHISNTVKNGDEILSMLETHCSEGSTARDDLCRALSEQQTCFGRVNHVLRASGLPGALKIHAPDLEAPWILVFEEDGRLGLLRRREDAEITRRRWVSAKDSILPFEEIDFPSIDSVATSRMELNRIRFPLEQLRQLICDPFDFDEIR